ncbi:hypothetical protein ITJ55_00380 [Frigoribacterium sp. VKM Ac-1396]|uniref:hypothetical protein n=1 Tax=Frigoribacterium sp. VKM Ac-1396 TaxID=2783821 RepID=UPI00188BEF75|nr:hypothetical protein [Frigoribacterium sp. VKM Ac-1396]MBF4599258.1 hypothetical protein [Frigoribacterium sp. VKM Ac-1396]
MSEPTPLPASSGTPLPPPPSADEMRVASERIDELTRVAELRGIDDTDAQADLWDAIFALDRWWFVARGELPDVQPLVAEVDGRPMVLAFTSPERARQHGLARGLSDDEAGRLLALPSAGFVDDAAALERTGVFGVLVDVQGRGPFAPLGALEAMRRFGLDRQARRRKGAEAAADRRSGRPASADAPADRQPGRSASDDEPADRFALPTDPPVLVAAHDGRRLRRQLVGSGLGVLLALALMAALVTWSITSTGWLWFVVALWVLPTLLPVATFSEYVGAARRRGGRLLAVHASAIVIDGSVVVPWSSVTRVSWVDGPAGPLAGGTGRSMRRVSFVARLFAIGDGKRLVNFHLRDHDEVRRHAGSAGTTRLVDPTRATPSLPADAAHAYVVLTDALGPKDFAALTTALRGMVEARGLGWARAAE